MHKRTASVFAKLPRAHSFLFSIVHHTHTHTNDAHILSRDGRQSGNSRENVWCVYHIMTLKQQIKHVFTYFLSCMAQKHLNKTQIKHNIRIKKIHIYTHIWYLCHLQLYRHAIDLFDLLYRCEYFITEAQ